MDVQLFKTIRYRGGDSSPDALGGWLPQSAKINITDLIRYVNWTSDDFVLLEALKPEITSQIDDIVDQFYNVVVNNEVALDVIENAGSNVESLKITFRGWILNIVNKDLNDKEYEVQSKIGVRHVQVNLPQHFMLLGINNIKGQFKKIIFKKYKSSPENITKTIEALDKCLDVRLSVMLGSYQDDRDRLLKENVLSENESIMALGRMSASIAHEIKNPLAGISGAIQVLKDKFSDESEDGHLMESVLEQVHRMSGTVKDLLDFARPVRLNFQMIRFDEIVDSLKSLLCADPMFNMEISFKEKTTENLEVEVDPVRLQSVFYNLFVNANEALKGEPGKIILSSDIQRHMINIYVEDTGPGIPEKWVAELFKPFATNKTHGTGLGLAICSKIIESHGGVISYSPRSEGACFCISLPKREK